MSIYDQVVRYAAHADADLNGDPGGSMRMVQPFALKTEDEQPIVGLSLWDSRDLGPNTRAQIIRVTRSTVRTWKRSSRSSRSCSSGGMGGTSSETRTGGRVLRPSTG